MEVPRHSLMVLHELHVLTILVELSFRFIQENSFKLPFSALLFFLFFLGLTHIVVIVIVEGVIVFNLLKGLLDATFLHHFAELFTSLFLFHPDTELLLLFVLSFELIVPVLLSILI